MIEALGLAYPTLFLTLAKGLGIVCVVFFLADQVFGEDENFDD